MAQLDVALLEQRLGIGEEALVTLDISGVSCRDLGVEPGLVVDIVEGLAVFPAQPVEGIHADEIDVVREPAA